MDEIGYSGSSFIIGWMVGWIKLVVFRRLCGISSDIGYITTIIPFWFMQCYRMEEGWMKWDILVHAVL